MGERRMFSTRIVETDSFTDMPFSAQALYFHLGMHTDDDGFVGSPKKIMRMVGCKQDDIMLLISKGFVIAFESGVIVITHWGINNTIRKDRYKPTVYQSEIQLLTTGENGDVYQLVGGCQPTDNQLTTICQPSDGHMVTQQSNKQIKQSCREIPTIHHSEIAEIVAYLNDKLGTRYKPTTANTKKHISARLNEGYTVADFHAVIDSKVQEWRGTEYEKYLRPDTLFGAKFESYLNTAENSGGNKQGGIAQFMDDLPSD